MTRFFRSNAATLRRRLEELLFGGPESGPSPRKACETCGGRGYIRVNGESRKCTVCKGTGTVQSAQAVPNGSPPGQMFDEGQCKVCGRIVDTYKGYTCTKGHFFCPTHGAPSGNDCPVADCDGSME